MCEITINYMSFGDLFLILGGNFYMFKIKYWTNHNQVQQASVPNLKSKGLHGYLVTNVFDILHILIIYDAFIVKIRIELSFLRLRFAEMNTAKY